MKHIYFHLPSTIFAFLFSIVSSNESDSSNQLLDQLKLLEIENAFLKKGLEKNQKELLEVSEKLINIANDMNKTANPYFPNTCLDGENVQRIIQNIHQIGKDISSVNLNKNEVELSRDDISEIMMKKFNFSSKTINSSEIFSNIDGFLIPDSKPNGKSNIYGSKKLQKS